jgi:hypothetical protein
MKGARFADVAAIQERVSAVLRSIPKEVFADSLQNRKQYVLFAILHKADCRQYSLCVDYLPLYSVMVL